ncbi:hypothetical protein BG261_00605 [Floricoccus tropicus]|uniref:KAP NTPase domain-containing protein n=1 Tax=Floricoccus tropicus TaxID=1859473 RepID=A0A1E8GSG5_9LACT|nr:P-loop NTPase fold protein [Floricoccus tropicus]OFI50418.1 hypothetical protein BG261_00605 [Floricoccus tropicus]
MDYFNNKKLEIKKINTRIAEKNFMDFIDNNRNKTIFFNGEWGSGKTTFLKNVENKNNSVNFVYLDLWRTGDNSSVVKYTMKKLHPYLYYGTISIILFIIMITTSYAFWKDNSNINSIFMFLVVLSTVLLALKNTFLNNTDDIYIWFLKNFTIGYSNKVLIIDDFDRVSKERQNAAYKLFNLLQGKITVIFIGDYEKINNQKRNGKLEDKYLQKIIDVRKDIPYDLQPQNIWSDYFEELLETFKNTFIIIDQNNSRIKDYKSHAVHMIELRDFIISENRNLRELSAFNTYVNTEFITYKRKEKVQPIQKLFVIYLYLFYPTEYNKLRRGWFPTDKEIERKNKKKNLYRNIKYFLSSNYKVPSPFLEKMDGYLVLDSVSNLSSSEAHEILSNDEKLRNFISGNKKDDEDFLEYISDLPDDEFNNYLPRLADIAFEELRKQKNIFTFDGKIIHLIISNYLDLWAEKNFGQINDLFKQRKDVFADDYSYFLHIIRNYGNFNLNSQNIIDDNVYEKCKILINNEDKYRKLSIKSEILAIYFSTDKGNNSPENKSYLNELDDYNYFNFFNILINDNQYFDKNVFSGEIDFSFVIKDKIKKYIDNSQDWDEIFKRLNTINVKFLNS